VTLMILTNKTATGLSLEMGLTISLISPAFGHEVARGFPNGQERAEPDLRITAILGGDGTAWVEALTEDGRAFLSLTEQEACRLETDQARIAFQDMSRTFLAPV
jgi:hypothetical protein